MHRKILLRSAAVALAGMMSLVAVGSPAQAAPAPDQTVPLSSLLSTAPVAQADRQVPNPSAVPAVSAAAWGFWLKNRANTSLCLDGSATNGVRWATCSTTSLYQQWNISGNFLFNYYYCLDGAVANGVRAIDCNGSDWQSWYTVGENLHNKAYREARSLDGSVSQGIRMNTTNYGSRWQNWYFQVVG
jgi:hypothetical protein